MGKKKRNKNLPASECPICQNDRLWCVCGSIKKGKGEHETKRCL